MIFAGILFFVFYFLFLKPTASCFDNIQNQDELGVDCGGICDLSCEQKNAQPLEVSYVRKVKDGDNKVILLAEIKNPNFEFGASSFEYSFDITDISGEKIKSISGQSFIYPGETKYLSEIIDFDKNYFSQDISLAQYIWKSKDEFKKPNIQVRENKTEINSKDSIYPLVVSGVIKNIDIISASKVIISAFIYDNMGTMIGISKTELENLNPTDEKNFTIVFPKDIDVSLINQNATRIYVDSIK